MLIGALPPRHDGADKAEVKKNKNNFQSIAFFKVIIKCTTHDVCLEVIEIGKVKSVRVLDQYFLSVDECLFPG